MSKKLARYDDAHVDSAIAEIQQLVSRRYPTTTYAITEGDDPEGIYLTAVVDVDDPDEVVEVFIDRLLALQIDEGLPLYVVPIRTPERVAVALHTSSSPQALLRSS